MHLAVAKAIIMVKEIAAYTIIIILLLLLRRPH